MKKYKHISFVDDLYSKAKVAGWKILYEEESDSLFWTKRPFPTTDKLVKVSKEVSFYLSGVRAIDGLMIQPFQSNFLSHNEEVSSIAKILRRSERGEIISISQKKKKENELLLAALSATIQKDIYKDAAEANYPMKNLEKFLSASAR